MVIELLGISVELIRKRIKNAYIRIKPPNGNVVVSVPLKMPLADVEKFLSLKIDWIHEKIEKVREVAKKQEQNYTTGEAFYVFGKRYILEVVDGDSDSVTLEGERATLTLKTKRQTSCEIERARREGVVRKWQSQILSEKVEEFLPRWESITGLRAKSYTIRYMKTRWGVCKYREGIIRFSTLLAKKPIICLEYIILHELLHFREKSHNRHFKELMDYYMRDWRKIKALLNTP